jgi:hypothetical protein
MISSNPTESQPSTPRDAQASTEAPLLKPQDPIEVGPGGNGTTTDPAGTDTRPPGYDDLELLA